VPQDYAIQPTIKNEAEYQLMLNQAYNHITNAKMEETYIEYFGQSIGVGIENRRKIQIMEVKFYEIEEIDDSLLKYAVIVSRYMDKWIFCKNKTRKWELPGGHREDGESIISY